MRDRNQVDPDGRGGREQLGGLEGGKTVIMIYLLRKESIFNKRGKEKMSDRLVHRPVWWEHFSQLRLLLPTDSSLC